MKMRNGKVERSGDKLTLRGNFRDRMRRRANVRLVIESGPDVDTDGVVAEGKADETVGALFAMAELAWSYGWRPRGLIGTVARFVETYKEPPEES